MSDAYDETPSTAGDDNEALETTDSLIINRMKEARRNKKERYWRSKSAKYTQLFRQFAYEDIDAPTYPSQEGNDFDDHGYNDDENLLYNQPSEGTVQHLNTNIRYKATTITYQRPEFHVESPDTASQYAVAEFFKNLWDYNNWRRITRKAALKSYVSGMGLVCVYWDDDRGVVWENIVECDFLFDPHLLDMEQLRWAGRRITVPIEEAVENYPAIKPLLYDPEQIDDGSRNSVVDLWCYWDKDVEAVVYDGEVISKTRNLYGDVPIEVYFNEEDPDSPYDTGDYDSCLGLQAQHTKMLDALNEQGQNGGSITLVNTQALKAKDLEGLERGFISALVPVANNMAFENAVHRIEASPINPAQQISLQMMERGIDARTAVTPEERGQPDPNAKFATQVAIANKMQGAMGQDQSAEFERFVNRLVRRSLKYLLRFMKPETPEEIMLFQALQSITRISVVEGSMTYQDPAFQSQNTMMALQAGMTLLQAGYQIDVIAIYRRLLGFLGFKDASKIAPDAPAMATSPMAGRTPASPPVPDGGGVPPSPPPSPMQ